MTAALETIGLTRRFGGVVATDNVSLSVAKGARHALIGPNGAGKTTLLHLLTGFLAPDQGRILLDGADVTRAAPSRRARRGMARSFQISQLFPSLSAAESVALALAQTDRAHPLVRFRSRPALLDHAAALLDRFGLSDVAGQPVQMLPYGRQRLLEIALALACRPRILLLDEPAAGVPEAERADILRALRELPQDVAVLLIEHDMDLVFSFAAHITVLAEGAILADGAAEAVRRDARVQRIYLGHDPAGQADG